MIDMPRQPFNPPFYSTFNYRDSSNDWSGNLPKPVAESAYQGKWSVETKLEEPGKFRVEWTPVWPDYFEACTTIHGADQDDEGYWKVSFEFEEELRRMDQSDLEPDFKEWLYERAMREIGDDPETDVREASFDFTMKGKYLTINLS